MIEQLRENLETTAESLAPSITLYGLSDPSTLDIEPDRYSQVLDTRLQVEQVLAQHVRRANRNIASWTFADGLYNRYDDTWDEQIPKTERQLVSEEIAIARSIDRSLEAQADGTPVIALDFGGGMGLSWMRLAAQPKYRAAIEAGQLAMVVTNLGAIPDKAVDEDGYSGIPRSMKYVNEVHREFTDADLQWAQKNQDYVHYLDVNPLELVHAAVNLPDGTAAPLTGNVGVIHERLSLAHTHTPDLALAAFDKLLGDHGTLRSDVATYYHLMHPSLFSDIATDDGEIINVTEEYAKQRRLGLVIGSMMLRQTGFSYELEERGHKGVFTR